ncbi:dihydroorotase, partial [Acinetobacter sp. 163]|nr:dihydroorotase [Acinetobacter sp. 163]
MTILIKGGRVIDPATKTDKEMDVFISKGKIQKVADKIETQADKVVDARGCYVMPGLIDLHVHLRDPGLTHKE